MSALSSIFLIIIIIIIRSSPAFLAETFKSFDEMLRSVLGTITNTYLHGKAWSQAFLPVKASGLVVLMIGVRYSTISV